MDRGSGRGLQRERDRRREKERERDRGGLQTCVEGGLAEVYKSPSLCHSNASMNPSHAHTHSHKRKHKRNTHKAHRHTHANTPPHLLHLGDGFRKKIIQRNQGELLRGLFFGNPSRNISFVVNCNPSGSGLIPIQDCAKVFWLPLKIGH